MNIKRGIFYDEWRGNGYFISALGENAHVTLALRWRLRFGYVRPAGKPNYHRLYIGPLEIEWSR